MTWCATWRQSLNIHDQTDALNTPDILLLVAEEVLVFDNLAGTLTMVVTANAEEPEARCGGAYSA